jgi:thiamine biosynthesis protein ThiS
VNVTLNGEHHDLPDSATVSEAIGALGKDPNSKGIAVALNGEVVARSRWNDVVVAAGDRLEVLNAIGGG